MSWIGQAIGGWIGAWLAPARPIAPVVPAAPTPYVALNSPMTFVASAADKPVVVPPARVSVTVSDNIAAFRAGALNLWSRLL